MKYPRLSRPATGLAALTLLVPLAAAAAGEPSLEFSGSVRARYEGLSGQSRAGLKADDQLFSTRTLVAGEADFGAVRLGAQLGDSRAWLGGRDSAISSNDVNALEPAQFYLGIDAEAPLGEGSALGAQIGRFAMALGSRRLISNDDYRNTGSSVGGVRIDGKLASGWSATTWYVLPDRRLPDDIPSVLDNQVQIDRESRHSVLWGGYVATPRLLLGGAFDAMFVEFRESDAPGRPTRDRKLDTWALRWYRDAAPGRWDYELETMRQGGRARAGTAVAAPLRPVDASFHHVRIGYRWAHAWKPRVAIEYDRASGDSGGDKVRRFDTLLGGRRSDLAPSALYNQVGRANLSAPGLRVELVPDARTDLMATWKWLYLASRTDSFSTTGVRDASGRSGNRAGEQIDLRARYWLVPKALRAELDTVVLIKERFLETAPNARPGNTSYYSLNLTYTF